MFPLSSPVFFSHVFFWGGDFLWGVKDLTLTPQKWRKKETWWFHEEKWYWNHVIPNHSYGYGSTIVVPTCLISRTSKENCQQHHFLKKLRCSHCNGSINRLRPWDTPYMHLPFLLTSPSSTSLPGGYPRSTGRNFTWLMISRYRWIHGATNPARTTGKEGSLQLFMIWTVLNCHKGNPSALP